MISLVTIQLGEREEERSGEKARVSIINSVLTNLTGVLISLLNLLNEPMVSAFLHSQVP